MPSQQRDLVLSRYERDGFVFPIDVMSSEEAVSCRRRLESAEARFGRLDLKIKSYLVSAAGRRAGAPSGDTRCRRTDYRTGHPGLGTPTSSSRKLMTGTS